MKGRNLKPRILYTARLSFKFDRVKSFSYKQKLREYRTSKTDLQLLKELLYAEKKESQLETRKLQMRKFTGEGKHNINVGNHPLTNMLSKLACVRKG